MCTGLRRHNYVADPSGHAVSTLAWLLGCGFEFLWGHGYSCIVFVVSSLGRGLCDGLISRWEESYRLCVCVCVWVCERVCVCVCVCVSNCVWSKNLKTERPTAELGCCATEKGKMHILYLEVGISVLNGNVSTKTKLNSVALVRTRTIPTERPPSVGEVSANFCG